MPTDSPLPSDAQIAQALQSVDEWRAGLGDEVAQTLRAALATLHGLRSALRAAASAPPSVRFRSGGPMQGAVLPLAPPQGGWTAARGAFMLVPANQAGGVFA